MGASRGGSRSPGSRGSAVRRIGRILVGVVALSVPAAPVLGQGGTLEEIVVTARFKEEKLQETPLAITALSGEGLEARSLTNITEVHAYSPNTIIQPLGAGWGSTAAAFIRGIGLGDNSLSFEPGVPIYIDDVYHGRPQGALFDLLDLERVEILRGPQGTLFGKNAIGGTVRMVSRKPQGDNSGFIEGTYGSYDRMDIRGSYDVSVIPDTLFARFAVSSKNRDGYFKVLDYECVNGAGSLDPSGLGSVLGPNDIRAKNCKVDSLGDENVASGRMSLRWIVSDALEVNFTADYSREDNKGPADKYTIIDPDVVPVPPSGPSFGLLPLWNLFVSDPLFGIIYDETFLTDSPYTGYHRFGPDPIFGRDVQNVRLLDHWGVSGVIEWQALPNVKVKSITSYREFENTFGRDSDGSPLPVDHTWDTSIHKQLSQEIQITGIAIDDRLDWATGMFYYDAEDSNQGWNFLFPLFFDALNHHDVQNIENWAVFVHGTFRVTDKLSITAGVRYTDDYKKATIFRQNLMTLAPIVDNVDVVVETTQWSPKAGISYQWNDDLMTYFQWSTGFRGGGFGPRPQNQFQVAPFDVEELESYEIGAKSDWFDRRLRVNAAWFWSEYTNQQQFVQQLDEIGVFWFRTTNTGESRLWGAEVEVLASPVQGLVLEGSMGYMDFLRNDPGATGLCKRYPNGDACPSARTPEWTAAVGATYTWGLGNGSSLALRGDWLYKSKIFFSPDDPLNGFQDDHALLNARLTWTSPGEAWSVALFGTNLTDKVYYHGKLSLISILQREQGNVAAPREWGITVRRSF
jgi:iron complex outermembrane receptor protein